MLRIVRSSFLDTLSLKRSCDLRFFCLTTSMDMIDIENEIENMNHLAMPLINERKTILTKS